MLSRENTLFSSCGCIVEPDGGIAAGGGQSFAVGRNSHATALGNRKLRRRLT